MCRLVDKRVIAPTTEERRIVSRVVLEQTRDHRLLAHNAADTHLHMELVEDEHVSKEIARRIEISLHHQLALPVGFDRAMPEPILGQRHLVNCFDYILRQQPRHGLTWDPYHEASNLPDLLELRVLGQHCRRYQQQRLPRFNTRRLLGYLGISRLVPANGPPDLVVPAGLAAAGLVSLSGRGPRQAAARRAILEVVGHQMPLARLARQMGVNRRTLQRARLLAPDKRLVQAIRLQLGLRQVKPPG